ncbi:hypothetical protein Rs2_13688 [Raphanus sativus]|nr:hypothetical protein Rs2_13688 [Raphanus sativus]
MLAWSLPCVNHHHGLQHRHLPSVSHLHHFSVRLISSSSSPFLSTSCQLLYREEFSKILKGEDERRTNKCDVSIFRIHTKSFLSDRYSLDISDRVMVKKGVGAWSITTSSFIDDAWLVLVLAMEDVGGYVDGARKIFFWKRLSFWFRYSFENSDRAMVKESEGPGESHK